MSYFLAETKPASNAEIERSGTRTHCPALCELGAQIKGLQYGGCVSADQNLKIVLLVLNHILRKRPARKARLRLGAGRCLAGPAKRMRAVFNLKLSTAVTVRAGTDTVCALKLLTRLITPSISELVTFRKCGGSGGWARQAASDRC